jgi:hypothetical protein
MHHLLIQQIVLQLVSILLESERSKLQKLRMVSENSHHSEYQRMHVLSVAEPDMVTDLAILTAVVHLYNPGTSVRPPMAPTDMNLVTV